MDLGFLFQLLLIAGVIAGVIYLLYWAKTGGLGGMFTRGAMGMFTGPTAAVASSLGVPTDPSGAIKHVVGAGGDVVHVAHGAAVDASHFVPQVGSGIAHVVTNVPGGAYVQNAAGQITNSAGKVVGTAVGGVTHFAGEATGAVGSAVSSISHTFGL